MPYKDPERRRAYERSRRALNCAYLRAYRRANPEKQREHSAVVTANRDGRQAGAPGRINVYDVRAVWGAEPSCHYCGGAGWGLDHVIPLSRGGPNDRSNLVRCCSPCNQRKGRRTPEEWRAGTGVARSPKRA